MQNFDPLLKVTSDLPDKTTSPPDAAPASASAVQSATTPQTEAEASAEAKRLLRELCGIKKPVLRVFDRLLSRRAA
jgi:hypothetical protein